jgi:hypothetical protein
MDEYEENSQILAGQLTHADIIQPSEEIIEADQLVAAIIDRARHWDYHHIKSTETRSHTSTTCS